MFENASSSEPVPIEGISQKTASSKKPSPYIFDSNADTQVILNTYKAHSFNWVDETVRVEHQISTKEYPNKNQKKKKRKKLGLEYNPPPPSPPPAPLESPVPIPISVTETIDVRSVGFDGTGDEHGELLNKERMRPGCTDAETNAVSSTLPMQDWRHGERPGITPDQVEIRMLVSGKHLALASSYFEKMFAGPYTEGKTNHSGLRQVIANDWDPEAFNIILTIIHGYHRDVPRSLSLEMLAKLAMIVDYYQCHESVELYGDIWLANLESQIPTVYGRDCILCIFISCVFTQPEIFQKMTRLALRYSGRLIEVEDFLIPASLLDQIDKARRDFLSDIFCAIHDLLRHLQEEPKCSYECSCMLLGVLTKELSKHGLLSPCPSQSFHGWSIEDYKCMIENFAKPRWYTIGQIYAGGHNCTIQRKLVPALGKAEKGLRVFNLQDFQIGKGHIRPEKS
ncbi:hypothetical protein FAVG1_12136 [Fusarium avenaceum]|nr:hypothetical protein FAVG1_12136 [Fusarium avenaceum]